MLIPIGKRIKKVRRDLDLTQDEVADMVGFSRQALSKIESGKTESPDPSNLISLAKALKNNFGESWLDKYLSDLDSSQTKEEIIKNASIDEIISIKFGGKSSRPTKKATEAKRKLLDAEKQKMKEEQEKYGDE